MAWGLHVVRYEHHSHPADAPPPAPPSPRTPPPPPCFWLYKGKERGSIIFIRPLIPASSWEIFFFWVKSCFLKCFKKIKKIDTFRWLFSLWHPFPLVMLELDLLQNSQGSILRIHIIRLVGNEETIHECLSGGEMMSSWNHGSCGWIVSSSQTLWVTREALQVYCKVALPKGLLSI